MTNIQSRALASNAEDFSIITSISFGVTKNFSMESSLSVISEVTVDIPALISISKANEEESTTVGIPMEITGMPRLSRLSSLRILPIPAPGVMPVFDICIVRARRSTDLEASASITMMASGARGPDRPYS